MMLSEGCCCLLSVGVWMWTQLKTLFAARKGQSLSVTEIRQAIQAQTNQEVKQVCTGAGNSFLCSITHNSLHIPAPHTHLD